jgi:hypothetical protein
MLLKKKKHCINDQSVYVDSGRMPMLGERRSLAITEANKFLEGLGVTDIPYLSPRFLAQLGLSERGGSSNNNRGGFNRDRGSSRGGFSDRRNNSGGFRDFDNNRRSSFNDRDGGFNKRENSFGSRDGYKSGFKSRDDGFKSRDDGFKSRDDGFKSRDDSFRSRDSGFRSRDSGFKSRGGDDDFKKPRGDFNRRGKFNRKDDDF